MANLNILEELRTRKEVEEYFKQLGKEITEEQLNALKQRYNQAQENNDALTLKQLDDVAGGVGTVHVWNGERVFESKTMIIGCCNGDRLGGYDEGTGHQICWDDTKFIKINSYGDQKGQIYSLGKIDTYDLKENETMVLIFEPAMDKKGNYVSWQFPQSQGDYVTAIVVPDKMLEKIPDLPERLSKMQSYGTLSFDSPFTLD